MENKVTVNKYKRLANGDITDELDVRVTRKEERRVSPRRDYDACLLVSLKSQVEKLMDQNYLLRSRLYAAEAIISEHTKDD